MDPQHCLPHLGNYIAMAPLPMATVCSLTSPRGGPGVLTVGDGLKSPVAEVEVSKAIPSFEAEGVGQAF
jgi:hypothetical protein